MENKAMVIPIKALVINKDARGAWCCLPYPGHPKGCPMFGTRDTCPPRAPYVNDFINVTAPMHLAIVRFNIGEHVARKHAEHPHWTERQCRNLLYWQKGVVSQLKKLVASIMADSQVVTYIPEAMGVDVFQTCAQVNIFLERNPQHYVHKVALIGKGKK